MLDGHIRHTPNRRQGSPYQNGFATLSLRKVWQSNITTRLHVNRQVRAPERATRLQIFTILSRPDD